MPFDTAINALATRVATEFNAIRTALNGKAATLTGEIKMWPTSTPPTGYLLCQGGTFQSTTFLALATLLGDAFGTHTGTTYYLPDFRGRSPLGTGTATPAVTGGTQHTMAQKGGEETHVLTTGESGQKAVTTSGRSASHVHNFPSYGYTNTFAWNYSGGLYLFPIGMEGANGAYSSAMSGETADHTHSIAGSSASSGHNTMHPYLGINFIIKT